MPVLATKCDRDIARRQSPGQLALHLAVEYSLIHDDGFFIQDSGIWILSRIDVSDRCWCGDAEAKEVERLTARARRGQRNAALEGPKRQTGSTNIRWRDHDRVDGIVKAGGEGIICGD